MQSIVVETKKKTTKDLDEQCPLVDYESREHVYKKPIFKIGYKEKLINLFTKREPLAIINGLVDPDEAVENVKINFKSNSRYKTVNYLTYFSLKVAEDITGSVKTNIETGHPQKESLFEQMDKKAIFYMEDLNIITPKSSHESIDYIGDSFFYLKSDEVVEKNVSAVKS